MGSVAPIGVFDSGMGGLSVAREIRALLPGERVIYAADHAFCPYGSRPAGEVRERTILMAGYLVQRGAKLLVIACNTATAVALAEVRARYPVPVVALEPAVKPAAALTRSGRVAVLATPRTARSDRLRDLIDRVAADVVVDVIPAPGLVELVEGGQTADRAAIDLLHDLLDPSLGAGADVVVLGCTHYPFLEPAIREVVGPEVEIIDSGAAVARRVQAVLEAEGLAAAGPALLDALELVTTGEIAVATQAGAALLGAPLPFQAAFS